VHTVLTANKYDFKSKRKDVKKIWRKVELECRNGIEGTIGGWVWTHFDGNICQAVAGINGSNKGKCINKQNDCTIETDC